MESPSIYSAYWPVFLGIAGALAVAVGIVVISSLLYPRRPNPVKQEPYECGVPILGPARVQFSVKYYLIALLFLLFDIEVIFIFAWAAVFRDWQDAGGESGGMSLGVFALIEMAIFAAILLVGLAYAWRKGALRWN